MLNYQTHILLETQIPESLTLRDSSFSWIVGTAMFLCVFLLAVARARQANIYMSVAVGMLKGQSLRTFLRDTMPLRGGGALLLLLNYWVATGLIVYLIGGYFNLAALASWTTSIFAPLGLLFFHLFALTLSSWITAEREVFRAPIAMKLLGAQVLGILYLLCAFLWVLKPDTVDITLQVVFWAFIVESSFRIIKSVLVVLRQGVSWYYIILYFCTLEILPFLVIYHYVLQDL